MVIDAGVAVRASLSEQGFDILAGRDLLGPPLLWTEATSALHELRWRNEVSAELAELGRSRLLSAPVAERRPRRLLEHAWELADELGWAKLYDAQYVALANLTKVPLLTLDARLRRGAARVVEVIGPAELGR